MIKLKIHVATKDEISVGHLGNILKENKFLPYMEYGISIDFLINYINEDLHDSLEAGSFVLLAEEKNNVFGLLAGGKSEWDSKHFGIDIANIKYIFASGDYFEKRQRTKELLRYFSAVSKFKLLMSRSHTEDIPLVHAMEDNSFQLMDTLVTYYFDFKNRVSDFKEICRIEPLKDETPELKRIAKTSFSETSVATDHFHADHRLNKAKSDALYEKWVEEASKDQDSVVLVAKIDDRPVGFTTGKINYQLNRCSNKKIGSLILSAVSPEYRQAHVYTSMIQAGLRWFSDKVDIVDLGTQIGNYSVQIAWQKLGFRIARSRYTWHKWID
jgi:ribosomal protein S18 acetylase RimI-like enzyme